MQHRMAFMYLSSSLGQKKYDLNRNLDLPPRKLPQNHARLHGHEEKKIRQSKKHD